MLSDRQKAHVARVKRNFAALMEQKYERGAVEHKGELEDLPIDGLLQQALEEAIDQVVYLMTARDALLGRNILDPDSREAMGTPQLAPVDDEKLAQRSRHPNCVCSWSGHSVLSASLIGAVAAEMFTSHKQHGSLTTDHFRAYTILQEEVGEVASEILQMRRASSANDPESSKYRKQAIKELLQVMSTAAKMIVNLDSEEQYS